VNLLLRIQRLEARVPRGRNRIILVWIGRDGRTIKAADTDPHLPDQRQYDAYLSPYQPGGGAQAYAAQAN
jgi:hypothetical protein